MFILSEALHIPGIRVDCQYLCTVLAELCCVCLPLGPVTSQAVDQDTVDSQIQGGHCLAKPGQPQDRSVWARDPE